MTDSKLDISQLLPAKPQILLLHASCILLIAVCYVLSYTLFKNEPEVGGVLKEAATLLWGALGFKPAQAVWQSMLQKMDTTEVARLSLKPPGTIERMQVELTARSLIPPQLVVSNWPTLDDKTLASLQNSKTQFVVPSTPPPAVTPVPELDDVGPEPVRDADGKGPASAGP